MLDRLVVRNDGATYEENLCLPIRYALGCCIKLHPVPTGWLDGQKMKKKVSRELTCVLKPELDDMSWLAHD